MTQKTSSNFTLDEIREAFKDLTLGDILPLTLSYMEFLKNLGDYIVNIGKLQGKSEKASQVMFWSGEEPEAFLALLVDKIPEDQLKPLVQLSLKLSSVQVKLNKLRELSSEEKISLGEEFKQIAKEIMTVLSRLR